MTRFRSFRRLLILALVLAAGASVVPAPVSAHELLPAALVEYLEEHPNATKEELEDFMASRPDLTVNGANQGKLIDTVFTGQVNFWHNAWAFIVLGVEHILVGTDHILFVLSLLLTFVSLRKMLKSVSAFTIAHSVTLILAGLSIVTLNTQVVESMIALSIAVVAIGTVFFRKYKVFSSVESKTAMIFLFGLFHGLGFAGLLQNFTIPEGRFLSSLLFFNVGIEFGQLFIILVTLPFIFAFRKKAWYPRAIQVAAIVISAVALYWFVERALGL